MKGMHDHREQLKTILGRLSAACVPGDDFHVDDLTGHGLAPPDFLPFVSTLVDSVHFGLLTDFGQVDSLDEADVLCVGAVGEPQLQVVARNLREFLSLYAAVGRLSALDGIDLDRTTHDQVICEWIVDDEDERQRVAVARTLRERFDVEPCHDLVATLRAARLAREEKIALPTFLGSPLTSLHGGPGVVAPPAWTVPSGRVPARYDFRAPGARDLVRMDSFLSSCEPIERLAFVRDAQGQCVFHPGHHDEVARLCAATLADLGFATESARLLELAEGRSGRVTG